ncbi:MAG: glutamate 5-kinase [Ruminococcaceae bacterium]|nr:glutamate 5-kinase [Oscillospiraceae bacterium]
MEYSSLKNMNRIVFKVGTSTLTYENGKINIQRVEKLSRVLCDLRNSGKDIVLVSSGAIAVGVAKTGCGERPKSLPHKQALAAVGQSELMYLYDKLFSEYNNTVAQLLLTADVLEHDLRKQNAQNTFETLLDLGIIPIVNENDTISTEQIEFGDNDTLSALVAELIHADLLVILSDIDGLYDKDPKESADAKLIHIVEKIDDSIKECAGGAGSRRGTGGMITKIKAGEIANNAGIDMLIINGNDPYDIYKALNDENIGTRFLSKK